MILPESFRAEIREELSYRIIRAQNEPIDDEEWFLDCAQNEILKIVNKYLELL